MPYYQNISNSISFSEKEKMKYFLTKNSYLNIIFTIISMNMESFLKIK